MGTGYIERFAAAGLAVKTAGCEGVYGLTAFKQGKACPQGLGAEWQGVRMHG